MKSTKTQKGITLVALIITIIVLLLLAVVAIGAVQNDGIINYAKNARDAYKKAQDEESSILSGYLDKINGNSGDLPSNNEPSYNAKDWDKKAAPEDVFVWQSDDPNNEGYGVVVGYKANMDNYSTLRFSSRCTKIATSDLSDNNDLTADEIRSFTKNIKEIELPETVVEIGGFAFADYNFENLKKINIPNSVTSIGDYAFNGCTGLTSITIPNSVISIGVQAFSGVPKIYYNGTATGTPWGAGIALKENIKMEEWDKAAEWDRTATPEDVFIWKDNDPSSEGYGVIIGYTSKINNYSTLKIPSRCKFIILDSFIIGDGEARSYTKNIKEIELPNTVLGISNGAFANDGSNWYLFSSLNKVVIPDSVTYIGEQVFYNCDSLKNVTIPNSVTIIGESAFSGCTGLTSITIPNSVTKIGDYAFWGCTGLTSVTIPNGVTSIENGVFSLCTGLTSVTIPNSVTNIGYLAFSRCTGLTSVIIPNSVTSIGQSAFDECTGITTITIPNSVTSIGSGAFIRCTGLKSLVIPDSVTSIDSIAFSGCTGLTSVTIPSSVTSIGWNAFSKVPHIYYNGTATGAPWGADNIN